MNKTIKVAVILHGLGANGIDTLFANLSENWSSELDITYFIAVDQDNPQFWENRVKTTQVKIIKLHDLDKGRIKMWPLTLYKALKSYGPFDVVHSNMDMLNGINMLIARLLKIHVRISHAHRSGSEKSTTVKELVKKAYQSLMKCMMKSLSTHRIGCSEVAGDYFFGKDNYEILINGIVLPHPC